MSNVPSLDNLTEQQLKAMDEAATLVINARKQAAMILRQSGIEFDPDSGLVGSPCLANHCLCKNFTGAGLICQTELEGGTRCGHRSGQHLFS